MQETFWCSVKCMKTKRTPNLVLDLRRFKIEKNWKSNQTLILNLLNCLKYRYPLPFILISIHKYIMYNFNVFFLLICITRFHAKGNIWCCEVHPLPAVLGVKSIGYKSPPTWQERGASTVKNIIQRYNQNSYKTC